MPTNLPDPLKRKAQPSTEEFLVHLVIAVMVVGMVIACAIVGWSAVAG
jgi:hypothetical protein